MRRPQRLTGISRRTAVDRVGIIEQVGDIELQVDGPATELEGIANRKVGGVIAVTLDVVIRAVELVAVVAAVAVVVDVDESVVIVV